MFLLLFAILLGLLMAFFATQNTQAVSLSIANATFRGVPLYVIVLGSLLLGIFLSWLLSLVDAFSSTVTIWGKDRKLSKSNKAIDDLTKKVRELEIENSRLKGNGKKSLVVDRSNEDLESPTRNKGG